VDAFGSLDVAVNDAGCGEISPFEQLSDRSLAYVGVRILGWSPKVLGAAGDAKPLLRNRRAT